MEANNTDVYEDLYELANNCVIWSSNVIDRDTFITEAMKDFEVIRKSSVGIEAMDKEANKPMYMTKTGWTDNPNDPDINFK